MMGEWRGERVVIGVSYIFGEKVIGKNGKLERDREKKRDGMFLVYSLIC